jgi:hypothetical protein
MQDSPPCGGENFFVHPPGFKVRLIATLNAARFVPTIHQSRSALHACAPRGLMHLLAEEGLDAAQLARPRTGSSGRTSRSRKPSALLPNYRRIAWCACA